MIWIYSYIIVQLIPNQEKNFKVSILIRNHRIRKPVLNIFNYVFTLVAKYITIIFIILAQPSQNRRLLPKKKKTKRGGASNFKIFQIIKLFFVGTRLHVAVLISCGQIRSFYAQYRAS